MAWSSRAVFLLAAICAGVGAACSSDADGGVAAESDAGDDAGWAALDASTDAGGGDATVPPTARAPCDSGSCWLDAPKLDACLGTTQSEDFSTGLYNVHRYPLTAPAGVSVELTVVATEGSWSPALILHSADGITLYDGEHASPGAVAIDAIESGVGQSTAKIRIAFDADTSLHLFVTSWAVVDGGFVPPMPSDASYALDTSANCPAPTATCPLNPASITKFGSGYYTTPGSPYQASGDTRPQHLGYDIYAPLGTPVLATESGTIIGVVTAPPADDLCGKSINLAADTGITLRYCHLDSVLVQNGAVQPGQTIGAVGKTGNAFSEHLHFGYLDAHNVVGVGTIAQKSEKVNAYIDALCK